MKKLEFKAEDFIKWKMEAFDIGDVLLHDYIIEQVNAKIREYMESSPAMYGPGKYCQYNHEEFRWESWDSRPDVPHGCKPTHKARLVEIEEIE